MFTITTINYPSIRSNIRPRTVGFTFTREKAVELVTENCSDIHEDSYNYCIIEEHKDDGLYPEVISEQWFKWEGDNETGQYVCIPQPIQFAQNCNWGIG
jgi:hypothetical protein